MRFIIKKSGSPASHDYAIQYEDRKIVYLVDGKAFSQVGRLELTDPAGRRIFFIQQIREQETEAYEIIDTEDDVIATIAKKMARKPGEIKIDSDYGVFIFKGDFTASSYAIFQETEEIARLEKKHPSSGDTYILDMYDYETEELLAMAAGAENLGFDNSDEEDFFDAFIMAAVVVLTMLF